MTTAAKPMFSDEQLQEIRKIVNEELEKHFDELNKQLESHTESAGEEGSHSTGDQDFSSIKGIKKYLQNLFFSELKKNIK